MADNHYDHLIMRWAALCKRLTFEGGDAYFDQILTAYTQPERHYHDIRHIEYCLEQFDQAKASKHAWSTFCVLWGDRIELALWLHDVVYDTRSKHNELDSALWAVDMLRRGGATSEFIEDVFNLIMATTHDKQLHHLAHKLIVDIDLSALGDTFERFMENSEDIRREYAWVPENIYLANRAAVLKRFLSRDRIYGTAFFAHREASARNNLDRAINLLEAPCGNE